jgi:CopG family nickel-responsive transcriptional regulator
MGKLTRFGVSVDSALLRQFDRLTRAAGARNRSEAFRDLIRARLVEEAVQDPSTRALGVLSLVYDHHKRELEERLTDLQHQHYSSIIAATHAHVDHDTCLEVILLRGTVGTMRRIADSLASLKGVQHSRLILTSSEPRS